MHEFCKRIHQHTSFKPRPLDRSVVMSPWLALVLFIAHLCTGSSEYRTSGRPIEARSIGTYGATYYVDGEYFRYRLSLLALELNMATPLLPPPPPPSHPVCISIPILLYLSLNLSRPPLSRSVWQRQQRWHASGAVLDTKPGSQCHSSTEADPGGFTGGRSPGPGSWKGLLLPVHAFLSFTARFGYCAVTHCVSGAFASVRVHMHTYTHARTSHAVIPHTNILCIQKLPAILTYMYIHTPYS